MEQMVAPVARRAVEIIRDMRPTNALSRLVTPEIAQVLSRRAALTRRLRASTGYAPPRQLQVTGVRTCVIDIARPVMIMKLTNTAAQTPTATPAKPHCAPTNVPIAAAAA